MYGLIIQDHAIDIEKDRVPHSWTMKSLEK